ncbi:MAG: HPr kinase/phosphorylase [Rhizobiaceae bacterium]
MSAINRHATAVILADRGVLITGASGSGKTALALTLMQHAAADGRFARLVADDQVFLFGGAGRLLVRAPATIAGLVEVRSLGPVGIKTEGAAVIDLAVSLEIPDKTPRMREQQRFEFGGIGVDHLVLPARDALQSSLAIAAWFGWPPFSRSQTLL